MTQAPLGTFAVVLLLFACGGGAKYTDAHTADDAAAAPTQPNDTPVGDDATPGAPESAGASVKHTLLDLGQNALQQGQLEQAKPYLDECLKQAQESGDAALEARTFVLLAEHAYAMGKATHANVANTYAIEAAQKGNAVEPWVMAGLQRAAWVARSGRSERALEFLRGSREAADKSGSESLKAAALLETVRVRVLFKQWAEAKAAMGAASQVGSGVAAPLDSELAIEQAALALAQSNVAGIESLLRPKVAVLRKQGFLRQLGRCLRLLGEAESQLGSKAEAVRDLEEAASVLETARTANLELAMALDSLIKLSPSSPSATQWREKAATVKAAQQQLDGMMDMQLRMIDG
jgi:tetratricopeptide (TPR) repeat protein